MSPDGSALCAPRLWTAGAERDVVLTRGARVSMAFNGEGVLVIDLQPLRLLLQRGDGLRREFGRIRFEKDPIADVDHEILLAAGRRVAGASLRIVRSIRASGRGKRQRQNSAH